MSHAFPLKFIHYKEFMLYAIGRNIPRKDSELKKSGICTNGAFSPEY